MALRYFSPLSCFFRAVNLFMYSAFQIFRSDRCKLSVAQAAAIIWQHEWQKLIVARAAVRLRRRPSNVSVA